MRDGLFPELPMVSPSNQIESKIVQCYFNLTRITEIHPVYLCLVDVLEQIKTEMHCHPIPCMEYLNMLYRMIGHTRDIHDGKGERVAAYTMLMAFHKVYPTLAAHALHAFLFPDADGEPQYGSWRDIGPLCEFLKTHSKEQEEHSLIAFMVEWANHQLTIDNNYWKYAEISRKAKSSAISNVSKWIPREKKQYGWLFDRLYVRWAEEHYPYIIKTNHSADSHIRAHTKCKQLYRKTIAKLNRALDTAEIKMCAQQWHNIEPKTIRMHTYVKHTQLFTDIETKPDKSGVEDNQSRKQICALKYKIFEPSLQPNSITSAFLPVGYMIRRAIQLNENKTNTDGRLRDADEMKYLNAQWDKMSSAVGWGNYSYMLPIVDVSITMWDNEDTGIYTAIGFAIMIAMRSGLQNRIIAMDRCATWIAWDESANFVKIVETVMLEIKTMQKTSVNLKNTFDLITDVISSSGSSPRFIDEITLIILSDYQNGMLNETIQEKYIDAAIIYWNMGSTYKDHIINPLDWKNKYVSGNSTVTLKTVLSVDRTDSPYDCVRKQLESTRYDRLSRYLTTVSSMRGRSK
jgi:hypothetical protein